MHTGRDVRVIGSGTSSRRAQQTSAVIAIFYSRYKTFEHQEHTVRTISNLQVVQQGNASIDGDHLVAVKDKQKEILFVLKRFVETAARQAHTREQIWQGRVFIPVLPKDLHRFFDDLFWFKFTGSRHHGFSSILFAFYNLELSVTQPTGDVLCPLALLQMEAHEGPMSTTMTQNNPGRAIALKIVAIFLFMVMAALIKAASDAVPPGQAVFFRSFFAMPVIMLWLWQSGHLHDGLRANNIMGHVWRGLIGTTAMAMTFSGLALLPLPEVTAIGYATPMFTVIFAAIFLGERVRLFRLSAVALGLIGVMIVIAPRLSIGTDLTGPATVGAILVLIASILRALVQIHVRRLVQTETTSAIVFYFSLTATILSLLTLPLGLFIPALTWTSPGFSVLSLIICAGLIGGVAQIMITSSFRFGTASMLAPFDYVSMIFATLIGWVVFSEVPTPTILIGAALVIAGGILIIWRERQLGVDRSKSKPVNAPAGTPN